MSVAKDNHGKIASDTELTNSQTGHISSVMVFAVVVGTGEHLKCGRVISWSQHQSGLTALCDVFHDHQSSRIIMDDNEI
jgi:hypothetical protein